MHELVPCRLRPPPAHSGPMDSMTMTLPEAVAPLAEAAEEGSMPLADSCFDPGSPNCTEYEIPNTTTVKMSGYYESLYLSSIFLFIRSFYFSENMLSACFDFS